MARFAWLLAVAVLPSTVQGWWSTGHMLTSLIAKNTLGENSAVFTAANQLSALLDSYYPSTGKTLIEAAVWADDLKAQGQHNYDAWHYVELASIVDTGFWLPVAAPGAYFGKTNVSMLPWAISNGASLASASNNITSILDKAVALRFLLHLVGDSHQPLHAASLWSSQFPSGDEGGNLFPITFQNGSTLASMNLHGFLDSMGGLYTNDLPRPLTSQGWAFLDSLAAEITSAFPMSSFSAGQLQETNPYLWAQETHALAVRNIYSIATQAAQAPLTPSFVASVRQLCEQQVALGGYRLALLMTSVFSNSTSSAVEEAEAVGKQLPIFRESDEMAKQPAAPAPPPKMKVLKGGKKVSSRPAFSARKVDGRKA